MRQRFKQTDSKALVIFLSVILLFIANFVGVAEVIKMPFNLIFSPIAYYSSKSTQEIKDVTSSFTQIGNLQRRNNQLQIENAELKVGNESVSLLLEENNSLKKQLDLGENSDNIQQVEVLSNGFREITDDLIINAGKKEKVSVGSQATIGSIYLGLIDEVGERSATVLLPNNRSSFLEVLILDTPKTDLSVERLKESYDRENNVVAKGVAIGTSAEIRVENIGADAKIKIGQAVVVNDSKVGDILYLGTISKIVSDPSAVTKVAYVTPVIEYDSINYLFIHSEDD